jgi:hypothetical protein
MSWRAGVLLGFLLSVPTGFGYGLANTLHPTQRSEGDRHESSLALGARQVSRQRWMRPMPRRRIDPEDRSGPTAIPQVCRPGTATRGRQRGRIIVSNILNRVRAATACG